MGGAEGELDLKSRLIRRQRFINFWVKNPTAYPIFACLGLASMCVMGIAYYHFVKSNYVHFDKRKYTEVMTRGYPHVFSDESMEKMSIYNNSYNPYPQMQPNKRFYQMQNEKKL